MTVEGGFALGSSVLHLYHSKHCIFHCLMHTQVQEKLMICMEKVYAMFYSDMVENRFKRSILSTCNLFIILLLEHM